MISFKKNPFKFDTYISRRILKLSRYFFFCIALYFYLFIQQQPPPNIHFNQPRGVPPQMMMYQTQLPPPTIQQQQDLGVFQNNNFVQQLNRFNVPRGMIVQMNSVNENATTLSGNVNFAQPGQPRFRTQW